MSPVSPPATNEQNNGRTSSVSAPQRLAIIGNQAFSMLNFRGPLIADIVARGHEVFAMAPDFDDEKLHAVRALGATPVDHKLSRTGTNPLLDAAGLADLALKLRTIRPDVALGYSIKPATYGVLAARLAGVPRRFAMIEGLGHVFIETSSIRARLLRSAVTLLYRTALARAERTLFLNPDDRDDFVALGLVRPDRAEVTGGIGVDLSTWMPAPPVVDPLSFLFIGRLLREKGILEFIEAARRVKAVHPAVHFTILGDVDSNPSSVSRNDVEAWVAEGLVDWPGQVDVAPWIAAASVFVLPSYREGVPRSTQEAMAMARPVITTDVPGCRETVVDGKNGFLVAPRDAAALAGAMQRFVDAPALIAAMGRESRAMAERHFDVRGVNERLMRLMNL